MISILTNITVLIEIVGVLLLVWAWRAIMPQQKYLAIYLISAVAFESLYMIADTIDSKYNLLFGNIYSLIDVWVLSALYTQWNKEKTSIFYLFSLVYIIVWLVFYSINGLYYANGIMHGIESLVIMLMSFIAYIRYLSTDYKSFKLSISLGFIFYTCTNIGIMSFSAYLQTLNSEKIALSYYLINLFSNLGLYIFITIGLIKCRKQSLALL